MIVRPFEKKDLQALAALCLELQTETTALQTVPYYRNAKDIDPVSYAERFLAELAPPEDAVFVAEADGQMIGYVVVTVELLGEKERMEFACAKRGNVLELYVQPAMRKSGGGSKLLEKAEEHCKSRGCEWILLAAMVQNSGALAFYKKHGYRDHAVELLKKMET